jgi:hypothetical protein
MVEKTTRSFCTAITNSSLPIESVTGRKQEPSDLFSMCSKLANIKTAVVATCFYREVGVGSVQSRYDLGMQDSVETRDAPHTNSPHLDPFGR